MEGGGGDRDGGKGGWGGGTVAPPFRPAGQAVSRIDEISFSGHTSQISVWANHVDLSGQNLIANSWSVGLIF